MANFPLIYIYIYIVLTRVQEQMKTRGATTIRGIGRVFRQLDSLDGNRKCDKEEFMTGLADCGVHLTKTEAGVLHLLYYSYNRFSWIILTQTEMELLILMNFLLESE